MSLRGRPRGVVGPNSVIRRHHVSVDAASPPQHPEHDFEVDRYWSHTHLWVCREPAVEWAEDLDIGSPTHRLSTARGMAHRRARTRRRWRTGRLARRSAGASWRFEPGRGTPRAGRSRTRRSGG